MKFSHDNRHLMTANNDGSIQVWDWRNRLLACPPMMHDDEVQDADFTEDGQFAVGATRKSEVSIWELATGKRVSRNINNLGEVGRQVCVVGNQALLSSPRRSVIDLAWLFEEPTMSTASMQLNAELSSRSRQFLGTLVLLTSEEWRERWETLRMDGTTRE